MIRLVLLNALLNSPMLQAALPRVRILALIETFYASSDDGDALQIMLENLHRSPYITEEKFQHIMLEELTSSCYVQNHQRDLLADLILSKRWDELKCHLPHDLGEEEPIRCFRSDDEAFTSFRTMVVAVFSSSRKIASTTDERRRMLGTSIHNTSTISELKELAFKSLETSIVFDHDERELVANDILNNRYDSLLLPNRFDCEERQRPRRDLTLPEPPSPPLIPSLLPALLPLLNPFPSPTAPSWESQVEEHTSLSETSEERPQHPRRWSPKSLWNRMLHILNHDSVAEPTEFDVVRAETDECPICLGSNPGDFQLPCGHSFCTTCIENWIQHHGDPCPCPMCRAITSVRLDGSRRRVEL